MNTALALATSQPESLQAFIDANGWGYTDLAVYVSPELAQQFLDTGAKNRTLSETHVTRLVSDILAGRWLASPQSLAFNKQGQMIDGQHRCAAIVKSGRGQMFVILKDFDPDVMHVIDTGRGRSAADTLNIEDFKSAKNLAAIARVIRYYCEDEGNFQGAVSNLEILNIMRDHPWIEERAACAMIRSPATWSNMGAVAALASWAAPMARVEEFVAGVASGENLSSGDPRLALRNKLLLARSQGTALKKRLELVSIIKAWNAFSTNTPMAKIHLHSKGEEKKVVETPEIAGVPRGRWPDAK